MLHYNPRPGFELESPCPFPTTITITLQAPPSGNGPQNFDMTWWFGLVSFFNDISTFMGYLIPKPSL